MNQETMTRPVPFFAARSASVPSLAFAMISLPGCVTIDHTTAMPTQVAAQGLVVERGLPAKMPEQSTPVPGTQLVLVPPENAAGMLVPVPFVADIAASAYHKHEAFGLARHFGMLGIYDIVQRTMTGSPLMKGGSGKVAMYPVAYLMACTDDRYRIALAARIEQAPWTGRYMAHLPTNYNDRELSAASPATIATMRQELGDAAATLRQLIERDAAGTLSTMRYRADVGSLQLACARVAGLVTANLMLARDAEVVEDAPDHIVLRIAGDLKQTGPSGGMLYGVHYLRKDQLHALKRKP